MKKLHKNKKFFHIFEKTVDGIYNTVLFKDVMQRKGITDKNALERVAKFLYDNIGNRTSMKNISDNIEGLEKNNSYNTVSTYVEALIDSFFVYKANNSTLNRELTPLKKINDNYPKYILTLDDDLDADFDGIKKINVLDWLLEKNKN